MTDPRDAHHGGPSPIALGSAATPLRRSLGPQAWCAPECLAGRATVQPDSTIAIASVRTIAAELGVATNTAHRAIGALVAAGLAEPDQRRHPNGTFQAGRNRLHLGAAITVTSDGSASSQRPVPGDQPTRTTSRATTVTPTRTRRAPRPSRDADQLSLL